MQIHCRFARVYRVHESLFDDMAMHIGPFFEGLPPLQKGRKPKRVVERPKPSVHIPHSLQILLRFCSERYVLISASPGALCSENEQLRSESQMDSN